MKLFRPHLLGLALLLTGCVAHMPPAGAPVPHASVATEDLIHAAQVHDLELAKSVLKSHPEAARGSRPDGDSPLHEAIMESQNDLCKLLIEDGADVALVKPNGNQPIHAAVHKCSPEVVALLIDKGAKVDVKAPNGDTPLVIAAGIGRDDIVKVLLDKGAKVDEPNSRGMTPLFVAVANGHAKAVDLLIAKGADLESVGAQGITPLMQAARNGDVEMLQKLYDKGAKVNFMNTDKATALAAAVALHQPAAVDWLLAHGADPRLGLTMEVAKADKAMLARLKAGPSKAQKSH